MSRRGPEPRQRVAVLWVSALALFVAALGLAAREEITHHDQAIQQAQAQTDELASSVSAALAFEDAAAMRQDLTAVLRNPQVDAAAVYGPDRLQRARLARRGAAPAPPSVGAVGVGRLAGRDIVVQPVAEQGQRLGYVYVQMTPDDTAEFMTRHTGLVILTALALLLLTFMTRTAARLARANERLSEEIEGRAAAEDALRQSQKLEALGQLTGGIAHDFNNLLQAIHGAFELILGKAGDERVVRRWGQNGLEAANRGASLTRQLLAFSRQQKLEAKPLVVAEILGGLPDLLSRTLGPGVELVFDLDRSRATVISDPTQLELALMNLAVNARDAMPGGGRLTIRSRKVDIRGDAVLQPGRYVELQVIDTGEGMPPAVIERAFDPFFTTKSVGKGTGLGLAQVYGVARQAGGDARIASTLGGGATVTLLLREADELAPTAAPAAPAASAPVAPSTATVLLVDDDPAVRAVLRGGLELRGFRVIEAGSGEMALELVAEHPEIAVIDYAMPGMNGAETAERLRRLLPELPVVLASGHADTAAVERALGGSATVLRKPFDIAALAAAITTLLGAPQLRRA